MVFQASKEERDLIHEVACSSAAKVYVVEGGGCKFLYKQGRKGAFMGIQPGSIPKQRSPVLTSFWGRSTYTKKENKLFPCQNP